MQPRKTLRNEFLGRSWPSIRKLRVGGKEGQAIPWRFTSIHCTCYRSYSLEAHSLGATMLMRATLGAQMAWGERRPGADLLKTKDEICLSGWIGFIPDKSSFSDASQPRLQQAVTVTTLQPSSARPSRCPLRCGLEGPPPGPLAWRSEAAANMAHLKQLLVLALILWP